jgi:hypothetical protein
VETRASAQYFESTYETPAQPQEVIAHYRKLFDAQGLVFQPNFDGIGTAIRGEMPQYSLLLLVRSQGTGSWVQISGAARKSPDTQAPAPRIETVPSRPPRPAIMPVEERKAEQDEHTRRVLAQAEEKHREQIRGMEKYDQPVYPRPKRPAPALAWPSWLVKLDGTALSAQKGVDLFGRRFLSGSFMTDAARREVQAYYSDLLGAHGYPVRMQSIASAPPDRKGWLEGEYYTDGADGPRVVIRIDLVPVGELVRVEVRMTASP